MENINNDEMELNQITESNTDAENDFLNSLDEEPQADDNSASSIEDSILLKQGEMTATIMLSMGENLIKEFGHKDFAFDKAKVEKVANSFAPLFVKYGGELPPWVLQYKEEIMFTFATGALCFTSVKQVKALKKADAPKEAEQSQLDENVTQEKEQVTNATH